MLCEIFEKVALFTDKCVTQKERAHKCQTQLSDTPDDTPIDLYTIHKLKQFTPTNDASSSIFKEVIRRLNEVDVYEPIQINDFFALAPNRFTQAYSIMNLKKKGFPFVMKTYDLCYFGLPSEGPHSARHFIWKQPLNDSLVEQQLVDKIRSSRDVYYSIATKREIKKELKRLAVIKPRVAEFLIKDIYDDASAPNHCNLKEILSRFKAHLSTGDDIS